MGGCKPGDGRDEQCGQGCRHRKPEDTVPGFGAHGYGTSRGQGGRGGYSGRPELRKSSSADVARLTVLDASGMIGPFRGETAGAASSAG